MQKNDEIDIDSLAEYERISFDSRRFPEKWQAILGAMLIQPLIVVMCIALIIFLGSDYSSLFRTEFGYDMFLYVLTQLGVMLPIPLFILGLGKKDVRASLRLKNGLNPLQILLIMLFAFFAFYPLQMINQYFISFLSTYLGEPSDSLSSVEAADISQLLFEIVITAGLPAICEEIMFRGLALRSYERTSKAGAVLISALMFAIMHGTFQQLAYTFICGIIFAVIVLVTDSLAAGMVLHAALNTLTALLTYGPVSDYTNNLFNTNEALCSVIILGIFPLCAIACIYAFIKYSLKSNVKTYGTPSPNEFKFPTERTQKNTFGKFAYVLFWLIFVILNLANAYTAWVL